MVSSTPRSIFIFCIAAPDAPLPKLSNLETSKILSSLPKTEISIPSFPFIEFADKNPLLGLVALPLSVISQFGDLAASVIKRRFGVKDYGKIFPGHGGVLDRFDSIIPVSVMTVLFLMILDKFA